MEKEVLLNKDNYSKGVLSLIDCFLKFTRGELIVLNYMLSRGVTRITSDVRSDMRVALNKDRFSLNNLISNMKKRGILIRKDGIMTINDELIESINSKEFCIRVKLVE